MFFTTRGCCCKREEYENSHWCDNRVLPLWFTDSHRAPWKWQTQVQVSAQSRGGCCRHQRGAVSRPTVSLQEDTLQRQTLLLYPGHCWHHLLVWTRLRWGTAGPTCWATHCLSVRNPPQWKFRSLKRLSFHVRFHVSLSMFLTSTFPGNNLLTNVSFRLFLKSYKR